jgi:hypothetical protein
VVIVVVYSTSVLRTNVVSLAVWVRGVDDVPKHGQQILIANSGRVEGHLRQEEQLRSTQRTNESNTLATIRHTSYAASSHIEVKISELTSQTYAKTTLRTIW